MKKILLLSLMFIGLAGFACDVQCPSSYDLTSSTSRFFSKITGQKALSQFIGKRILKKVILNNITSGKIKTDVKAFSARDLKAGRFKSLEIEGTDVVAQGIYISYIHLKTLCDFNYIDSKDNGDVIIKENIPLGLEVRFTEDNLNKTMESSDYKRIIADINKIAGGLNFFTVDSTNAKIKNDKFYYVIKYYIPFIKGYKTIVLVSDLVAQNGEIEFRNTKIMGDSASFDIKYLSKIINYVNPLDFSLQIDENKNIKVNIETVKIEDNKVVASGVMTVLKDKE